MERSGKPHAAVDASFDQSRPGLHDHHATRVRWGWQLSWLVLGAALATFAVLALDLTIARHFPELRLSSDVRRMIDFAEAFGHGGTVTLLLLTLLAVHWPDVLRYLHVGLAVLSAGIVANLIKLVFPRTRPKVWLEGHPTGSAWQSFLSPFAERLEHAIQSFPSGHTAAAFALATGLSFLFPGGRYWFYFFALGTAVQRMRSGAHFLSDTIVGAVVGTLVCSWVLHSRALAGALANARPGRLAELPSTDATR